MRVQAGEQGRFLSGRPPYGFRLVDDGPHPNRAHARWGRRRRRLDPDPDTALWVRWIFEQRASGRSVAGLARELNERGVRCPSGADRVRNPHRPGQSWMVRTVTGILENPRYTGREVWNRHSTESRGGDHARRAGGAARRTQAKDWVLSDRQVHPALVSDELFLAVQGMRTARKTHDGVTRRYVLAGLLVCEVCGRRLDSHWVNGRAGYRCRHGYTSARGRPQHAAKNVYVREDKLLVELRERLLARPGCEPTEMADHLRRQGQVIVCTGSSWTLEDTASLPARTTPGFGDMQLLLPME